MRFDLLILGNLIVDDIVYDDGSTRLRQPGGATLYMGLAARLWGLKVGLVSLAGDAFPAAVLDELAARGVDLGGVRRLTGPGLRTWLLYEGAVRRVVHRLDGATHLEASPTLDDLPPDWRPRAVHLAPMPFDLQVDWVRGLGDRYGDRVLVSLDPYELLTDDRLAAWRNLLRGVDLLFFSEDEMASSAARRDPEPTLRRLATERLKAVLYKRGERGGLAYRVDEKRCFDWSARANRVRDTTGAGDAFACGVLAGLLQGEELPRAVQRGVVSASFALEDRGAEGLLAATPETAAARLRDWFSS